METGTDRKNVKAQTPTMRKAIWLWIVLIAIVIAIATVSVIYICTNPS